MASSRWEDIGMSKVAVITGATKGWGLAAAEAFSRIGIAVVVNGRNADVHEVVDSFRKQGCQASGLQVETDTAAGVGELMAHALKAFGKVNIWVNSLGIQRPESLLSLQQDTWDDIIRVQLTSIF